MGRSRKPVEMQTKHLTTEEKLNAQRAEETVTVGREQLEKPPTWLIDTTAKKEFIRIVTEFEKIDIVGNLDLNNIAGYCNAYSMYRKTTKELKKADLLIETQMPNGTQVLKENPLIKIQKNYAEEMRKFASLCGLTIDSRLKAGTIKISKENEDITDEFGDI